MKSIKEKLYPKDREHLKIARIIGAFIMIISIIISGIYLFLSWNKYKTTASSEAITLAKSLSTLLQPEHITTLSGGSEDLDNPDYITTKNNLIKLVETTNKIDFAYLMSKKEDKIVFLLDSEPADSSDYSPPGQVYEEADGYTLSAFTNDEPVLTDMTKDRWGTWISALVPVKDPANQQTIAVFGLDFSAKQWHHGLWKQMIPDFIIVAFFLMFVIALLRAENNFSKLKMLSKKLTFDEALYHNIYDKAPIGIAILDDKKFAFQSDYGDINMNQMFEKILGRTKQEISNIEWSDITHPDDLSAELENFNNIKNGEINGYAMQKRFRKSDGSYVWTYIRISRLLDGIKDNKMFLCLLEDISTVREYAESLKESERSKSVLISNLPGMAYRCRNDRDWTMYFISEGCYKLTGYLPESFINNKELKFNDIISPEYRDIVWTEWEVAIEKKQQFKFEYEITAANGERKWVLEMGQAIYNENGDIEALEGLIIDISDRKEMENRLIYINEHDRTTGLLNNNYLEKLITNDKKEHSITKLAIISVNISTVQSLSVSYGYNYTLDLIKKIAETLNQFNKENYILIKTFENRFIYYIKNYNNRDELMDCSQRVANALEPILSAERIGAGIGILEVNINEDIDLNNLSKKVIAASETAINMSDKLIDICYYDENLESQIAREEYIKHELTDISMLDNYGGLYLQYQPIFDFRLNKISGFEALARLKTEKFGEIPPLEFIPIAEKTKLIIPIGWKITHMALCFLKRLENLGLNEIHVSINFSAIQLLKNDFIEKFLKIIKEMEVDPQNIGIEITESIFTSGYEEINKIITILKSNGINIAIDDFGTGYSSLARERELNVDCLKIDKYFIDNLVKMNHDRAITSDIISMAHKLGHCTIAEGVEYEEQRQYLLKKGCDKIQGYLIGKPLDKEAAIEVLKNQN